MKRFYNALVLVGGLWFAATVPTAQAAACLMITLTGTQSGPSVFNGQAGAGTLVRYGDDSNDCGAVKLQFDSGRGTNMRLSQINVTPVQLNAIFFTHMHGDHTEGFADVMMLRWYFKGPKIDIVCSSDATSAKGVTNSCRKFVTHVADSFIQSGEIAERRSEDSARLAGGPAELTNVITFDPTDEPQVVWSSGDMKVSAIRSTHTAGHASFRVDTPAGSVVIGGDAGNDVLKPPRASSTSAQVEKLAKGVDIIVHSAFHPVMGPDRGSGFPPLSFYRQSLASDLGAMAQRVGAKHLMLTHLGPSLGAVIHNQWKVPGGPLTQADYRKAVEAGGFTGNTIVGTDLATLRFPAK
ncbi:MAG TPA: MBL fold metallo-hydrolase [Burkholderiales bacterium]